jgi:hypothetical protein
MPRCVTTSPTARRDSIENWNAQPSRCQPETNNLSTLARESDRPSWPTGFTPHCVTPITLPAALCLPLVAFGASVTQVPCRHGPTRAHFRCRIYDCRRNPHSHHYRSLCPLAEGVHIRLVRCHNVSWKSYLAVPHVI